MIWKSSSIIFNQAIEEVKLNVIVVDNAISDKHVQILLKMQMILEKVQSPLTNIVVYDVETYKKDRAVPYCSCI